jgi:hypothetical protein
MTPSDVPEGFIRIAITVEGTGVARAVLRDTASAVLRRQLPDCWGIDPDDTDGATVRHAASECKRGCRDDEGVLVDGSQHYRIDDLLRVLLLFTLGVPIITQHGERADDGGLRA